VLASHGGKTAKRVLQTISDVEEKTSKLISILAQP